MSPSLSRADDIQAWDGWVQHLLVGAGPSEVDISGSKHAAAIRHAIEVEVDDMVVTLVSTTVGTAHFELASAASAEPEGTAWMERPSRTVSGPFSRPDYI